EFPHVIVLDGTFDDNPDTLIFGYEGLELSQLRIKTPNLEKLDDAYAAALENERRLIREDAQNKEYVAYTRAESSLLILKNEKKSALLKLEAASLALPYERGELSITPAPPPPPNPEPYENPRQDFGKQGYIKPREYTPNDYEAIYLGLAVHALFEMEGNDYARNRYGALCDYDKALKLYDAARTQPEYRELVARGRLHREYPFTYQGQSGYIDLLIEHDDALVVVDYKSATPHDPSGYEKQVRHYMETMRTLKGKPCRGYLFYLDTLKLQEVA
ncbi:PD-(D/E)XK nuclease family protein, partial [Hydrogenimonas sp.]